MYTAVKEGTNYAVYFNGNRISTTSESGLANFGLSPTKLSSSTPAPTALGSQATQQAMTSAPATTAPTPAPTPAPAGGSAASPQVGSGGLVAVPKAPSDLYQAYQMPGTDLSQYDGRNIVINGKVFQVQGNLLYEGNQGYPSWAVAQMPQFDASGRPISTAANPVTPTTPTAPGPVSPEYTAQLEALLKNQTLTEDQRKALREYFDTVASNDTAKAAKMVKAFETGLAYSSPVFRAQALMFKDALEQGLSNISGDLALNEKQLRDKITKLESDLVASNEYLDLGAKQELEGLKSSYERDLDTVVQNMAATGKTSSSVRQRSEEILKKDFEGKVETKNRELAYVKNKQISDTGYNANLIRTQLQQLNDKANQDRIAKLRETESKLGTLAMLDMGYSGSELLGSPQNPIGGELDRAQFKDAFSFAGNFF